MAGSRGVVAAWPAAEAWAVAMPRGTGWARRAKRDFGLALSGTPCIVRGPGCRREPAVLL